MIKRLYVHNFRCLENFELPISGLASALLIGKNGAGKTTIARALEVLQRIARGTNRVGDLVKPGDICRGRADVPVRFEIEVDLRPLGGAGPGVLGYSVAFEFPQGFRELRVREERLTADGEPIFTRELARVHLHKGGHGGGAQFLVDWHLVALPVIQTRTVEYPGLSALIPTMETDPLVLLREWLATMLILRPVPSLIRGDSDSETLWPNLQVTNLAEWFSGLVAYAPAAYSRIDEFLRQVMPDLREIKNPPVAKDSKRLEVQFSNEQGSVTLPFEELSDGEKCFLVAALVLAQSNVRGPVVCFWDEPDNYLALSEVGHLVMALRRSFQNSGQFIATSHNPEAIRQFSEENTFVLQRRSHIEPTIVRPLKDLQINGDLVGALARGDVEQ